MVKLSSKGGETQIHDCGVYPSFLVGATMTMISQMTLPRELPTCIYHNVRYIVPMNVKILMNSSIFTMLQWATTLSKHGVKELTEYSEGGEFNIS
jgi:hypothetical protein